MPIPIRPPRGQFNQLPDVRMVQHRPEAYGALEGRALGGVGDSIANMGKAAEDWGRVLAARQKEKDNSEDDLNKNKLREGSSDFMKIGSIMNPDGGTGWKAYFNRKGGEASGCTADYQEKYGAWSTEYIDSLNISDDRKQKLRKFAIGVMGSDSLRLKDHEWQQGEFEIDANQEAALKGEMEQIAIWAQDDARSTVLLGNVALLAKKIGSRKGLSGEALDMFQKEAVGNAEAVRATEILNSANAIPVSLTPDQYDERFEGDLETVERFIHDEKNALSPTQKQKLNDTVEQARRVREERRHAAVNKATTEANAASLNYRLGKAPYDEAARMAETLPPYQRAALETELDNHRRVLLAAEDDDRFEMMQNRLRVLAKTSRTPPQQAGQADSPAKPTGEQAGGVGWINQIQAEQNTIKAFATEPEDPRGAYLKWQKTLPSDLRRRSEKRLADADAHVVTEMNRLKEENRKAFMADIQIATTLDSKNRLAYRTVSERMSVALEATLNGIINNKDYQKLCEIFKQQSSPEDERLMQDIGQMIAPDAYAYLQFKNGTVSLAPKTNPSEKAGSITIKKNPFREGISEDEKREQYFQAKAAMPLLEKWSKTTRISRSLTQWEKDVVAEETSWQEITKQDVVDLINQTLEYSHLSEQEKIAIYGKNYPTPMEFCKQKYAPVQKEMLMRDFQSRLALDKERLEDARTVRNMAIMGAAQEVPFSERKEFALGGELLIPGMTRQELFQ